VAVRVRQVAGKQEDREVSGLGDPQARFSFLLYGALALPDEFVDYKPDSSSAPARGDGAAGPYDSTSS
jgi:hypothetical protein